MKNIMLGMVAVLVSMTAKAQISVGFKGSVNGSTVSKFALIENITPEFKLAPAAGGGVFLDIPVYKNLSFQPEINFIQKGFKISESFDLASKWAGVDIPLNASVKMKMQYVQIPLLAKIKTNSGVYFVAGPSVGYLTNTGLRINVFNLFPLNTSFPKNVYKELEMSIVGAVGIEKAFTNKVSIITEARYEGGVSRLLNMPVVQLPVRSQTYGANIGFKIKI
jgi:Outer membrane protein beta-barrel domain